MSSLEETFNTILQQKNKQISDFLKAQEDHQNEIERLKASFVKQTSQKDRQIKLLENIVVNERWQIKYDQQLKIEKDRK